MDSIREGEKYMGGWEREGERQNSINSYLHAQTKCLKSENLSK